MSFAYLPLYTGDYIRDTRHLSCCEHGVYLMLLIHCWDQQGPLPLDEKKISGICGARSGDEIEAMRRVLDEFFTRMDDGWYNRRIQLEIERANAISLKRSSAGAKGYQAKAKHLLSKSQASASTLTPTPIPSPPLSPPKTISAVAHLPVIGGADWPVDAALVKELETAYPAVDAMATLKEIRAWCITNPTRCKTPRGLPRFINRWFEKEQNRG